MKKRIIKIFIAISAVFIILLLRQITSIFSASYIVRVGYRGLENLFHIPNEYYAVNHSGSSRISGFLAKALFSENIETCKIYDDTDTHYWFAMLEYAPDGTSFTQGDWTETNFGENYRLVYDNWTRSTPAPDDSTINIMRHAADTLHSGAPEEWSWQGGGTIGLTSFMLIRHDDEYLLVQDDKQLFHLDQNGNLKHLMERPKGGFFDYYLFK